MKLSDRLFEERHSKFCYGLFVDDEQGQSIPAGYDAQHRPITFPSEEHAQRAIARIAMDKLGRYLNGEIDFADALYVDEYYLEVRNEPERATAAE